MAQEREVAGVEIEEVIAQVQGAIRLAERLDPGDGPGVAVT